MCGDEVHEEVTEQKLESILETCADQPSQKEVGRASRKLAKRREGRPAPKKKRVVTRKKKA
jgi:hypothetical protein